MTTIAFAGMAASVCLIVVALCVVITYATTAACRIIGEMRRLAADLRQERPVDRLMRIAGRE